MEIYDVKVNGFENPIGFDLEDLRISWKVRQVEGSRQSESSIEVSTDPKFQTIVFKKSGHLNSLMERLDFNLQPYTRYFVRIQVKTNLGEQVINESTYFETGKLNEPWKAQWIGTKETDKEHPVFVKHIDLSKKVTEARLYISGLGLFESFLNGEKIGNDVLAPFFSDYDTEVQYCTYDVTELLEEKRNKIEIFLGNGWFKGRFGFFQPDQTKIFMCIAELRCEYEDGTIEIICTDESWQYKKSNFELTDIYDGETQNELLWENEKNELLPIEIKENSSKLIARKSLPLEEMEEMPVKKLIQTPKGEVVLDFGQNFAGYVECDLSMNRGEKLILEFGEILQGGNFYNENYRTAKSTFTYISSGKKSVIKPHFTFFGFRYVRVSGVLDVQKESFIGKAIYSKMEQTGKIETSNKKVNRLVQNTLWGQKSNFLEFPTDCPQRDERLAWTGDAQVFSRTAGYQMNTKAFYQKFLDDLRLDQKKHDGKVAVFLPNTVPDLISCAWSDIGTFLPNMMYEYYGDPIELEKNYPLMRDWVEYINREDIKRGEQNLWNFGFQFGDWLALDGPTQQSRRGRTDLYYVASLYYYASTKYVADAAKVLGNGDEAKYRQLADKIFNAVYKEYYTPNDRLAIDTQTGYLLALNFGLYKDRARLINDLKSRLKHDCYRIKGGFVGATMMNTVLAENGMEDLAYDLLFFEGFPSWLYQVNLGATTIWERWNSVLPTGEISGTGMNSLNHYSWGSVVEFLYRNAAGIIPMKPGFKKVKLEPKPDVRFSHFDCAYESASGRYSTKWEVLENGEIYFKFEVPFDGEAEIVLPYSDQESIRVEAGIHEFTYKPTKDYRILFDENTRIEFLLDSPKAKAVIEKYLGKEAIELANSDIEEASKSIQDLKNYALVLHAPTEQYDKTISELKKIRI